MNTAMQRITSFVLVLFVALVSAPLVSVANDNAILDGFVAREYESTTGVTLPIVSLLHAPPNATRSCRRVNVVGQSLGGYGAWDFVARHPGLLVAALRTVSSSVRYTEYSNVGHDVWTRAFRERDLQEWMFAQRRR